jgi:hypothetical protein
VDVRSYVPKDPADDGVWMRLMVGPEDGPGEESFDLLVCTPVWLQRLAAEQGPQIGRHRLIVAEFDLAVAELFLTKQIERIDEPTWGELAAKVARLGYWEFEDHRP